MKLYSGPLSLFTAKVRIALDEKGIPYDRVEVGWSPKDRYVPHHPDVIALNPKRQVPVLVDGPVVVYDSTLILEYLEERHPEPPLYPRDLPEKTRCRQLEAAADEIVFPDVWSLIEEAFYPAGEGGRDEARLAEARENLRGHYAGLEKILAGRGFLCGAFSAADIATGIMVQTAATLGAPPDDAHPRVREWHARTVARPSVAREVAAMNDFVAGLLS